MAYETLTASNKQRLAAAFTNIKDKKSAMAKVNWEDATLAFKPDGSITGESFKTSISRMKSAYSSLSATDKERLAASFCSLQSAEDYKAVMSNITWAKAATDFKPSGKPISGASFRTSIQRMLKDKFGGHSTSTQASKRKAPATSAAGDGNRRKKTKTTQDTDRAGLGDDDAGNTDKEDNLSLAGSDKDSLSPLVKDEDIDDDGSEHDELSQAELNFFA